MVSQAGVQDVVNSWISSLTRPAVETLAAEVPRASQNRILLNVGLTVVASAILGLITGLLGGNLIGDFLRVLIVTAINFGVWVGATYLGARLMQGTGTVEQHAWVFSTYWAPIAILSNIPIIGWFIGWIGFFYQLYLLFLTNQAVHRLNMQNSIIAVLIGGVIGWLVMTVVGLVTALIF